MSNDDNPPSPYLPREDSDDVPPFDPDEEPGHDEQPADRDADVPVEDYSQEALERAAMEQERELAKVIDLPGYKSRREREAEEAERKKSEFEKPRWVTPLIEFMGEEEPDDDDSADWNIRDLIPRGEPSLWTGRAKGGKTWSMLAIAICVAMGMPFLGFENTRKVPARVQVIALEDSERRLRKRVWELCRWLGISPNNPTLREHLSISRQPLRLPDNQDRRAIESELKAWGPAVVLLDNLTRVMSGDQTKTADAALFCTVWMQMCLHVGANFTYLHHLSKDQHNNGKGDPFERIRGAGAFVDAARHIVLTIPKDLPNRQLSEVRMRGNLEITREPFMLEYERVIDANGRATVSLVDQGDAATMLAEHAATAKAKAKEAKQAEKRKEADVEYSHRKSVAIGLIVKAGVCSGRDLAVAIDCSEFTARKVLAKMEIESVAKKDGKKGYILADADPRDLAL